MPSRLLNISEASLIALHAMRHIADAGEPVSCARIAEATRASRSHLSKVLRKLVVEGRLSVCRGPRGGFYLTPEQGRQTFMDVFEIFEGPCRASACAMSKGPCGRGDCIFGGLLSEINGRFERYFKSTRISKPKNKARNRQI